DPLVRAALDRFLASLSSRIDMEETARALGVNRNTLDRRFAAEFGRTASAELHRQRLMLARRLLADSRNKVAYVASVTGFSSPSHLGTAFREDTGLSPGEWRKRWL
ncbi:MAG: helix-turn-helix transcriptional regulator, partial [Kiritimatiellae bacterium]|nr:helix-turn-helix transcriptional regulator [Kiritimatiellia bacterium]